MIDKSRTAACVGAYFVRAMEFVPRASVTLGLSGDGTLGISLSVYAQDEDGERRLQIGRMIDSELDESCSLDAADIGARMASQDGQGLLLAIDEASRRAERAAAKHESL